MQEAALLADTTEGSQSEGGGGGGGVWKAAMSLQ